MAFYDAIPASDGTSLNAPSNAEFKVFEVTDTARANPLELRTVAGMNAAPLTTTAQGVVPPVEVVSPNFEHIFKSGEWEWRRESSEGIKRAALGAQTSAELSASDAREAKEAAQRAVADATKPVDDAVDAGIERADIPAMVARQVPTLVAGEPSPSGDDSAQLNSLMSIAGVSVSLLPGRTYRLRSGLTLGSNTTVDLNGATLDFSQMAPATTLAQRKAISAEGSLSEPITITAGVEQWSRTVAGISSTASLRVGDLVLLSNNERPIAGMTRTALKKAQLAIVKRVDSSTQVTLTTGAIFTYGVSGLRIQKVNPVENISVHGGRIRMGGVGSGHNGIYFHFGRNCTVRDTTIEGAEDQSITFSTVYNGKALNNTVNDATSNATLGNTGYGVSVVEGSRHVLVQGNQFRNCRHFVAGGGTWPTIQVDVLDNQGEHSKDAAFDCHEPTLYWTFRGNTASGSEGVGFIIRGQHITVDNNTVVESGSTGIRCYTFDGVSEQVGIRVTNNRVIRCAGGIEVDGLNRGGDTVDSIKRGAVITGNTIQSVTYSGILLRHFIGALVSGNIVREVGAEDGILCTGLTSATPGTSLTMVGNDVRGIAGAARSGIKVADVIHAALSGNSSEDGGAEGITISRSSDVAVNANRAAAASFAGLRIDGGARVTVTGGTYSDATAATGDGVRVTNSADVSISGTTTKNPRHGINITGTNYVVVTGNNARANGAGIKINIDAAAISKIDANNIVA